MCYGLVKIQKTGEKIEGDTMFLSEAKPEDALVFIGFNGDDEDYEKVLEMGLSVGVMVIVKGVDDEGILVEFEDGRQIKIEKKFAEKIVVNPV